MRHQQGQQTRFVLRPHPQSNASACGTQAAAACTLSVYTFFPRLAQSLECGFASSRVTTASIFPCGSLVAMYTSFSNCAHAKRKSNSKARRSHVIAASPCADHNKARRRWCCVTQSHSKGRTGLQERHLAGHWRAWQEVDVGQVEEDRLHGRYPMSQSKFDCVHSPAERMQTCSEAWP